MSTATQAPVLAHNDNPDAHAAHMTVINRVGQIPLVSDSLAAVHATLTSNPYTRYPYSTAAAVSAALARAAEPAANRLAPVLQRADSYANAAVDAVQSRYPYPFEAPTDEICGNLRVQSEHAYHVANSAISQRVQGIDQRFTPVVDRFASVVNAMHTNGTNADTSSSVDANVNGDAKAADKFQYQRAYKLSLDLKDSLYVYTSEQIKQINEHNVLVHRASTTAQSISSALTNSYGAASARVHHLSDTMLAELAHLQTSAAALPAHAQASLGGLAERIAAVIADLTRVKSSQLESGSLPESDSSAVARLKEALEKQVHPLLAGATARVQGAVNAVVGSKSAPASETANGHNGVAH